MPDIFISYNREDGDVAKVYRDALVREGYDVWWDATLRSGETYDEVTEVALRGAKAVVVLWSPRSVASRWVRAEATIADRNRTLLPVTIELCDRPVMFELTQTAELSHWRGEAADLGWLAFLGDVGRMVGRGAGPVAPIQVAQPQSASKLQSRSARPSIAVLPFISRSGAAEDEFLADDILEEMTGALSASLWMRVIASSATRAFRKEPRDLRQIGHALSARYLLEGNVRRAGDNLRFTTQLVEADNGDILWTQKFDRPLADFAEQQDKLVAEVVAHIAVQVRRAEAEHALEKSGNLTAWEAYVRSLTSGVYQARAGYEASVREFKAAALAQNDGFSYSVLAAQQGQVLHLLGGDDPGLEREIVENIKRALAVDPNKPDVLIGIAGALIGLRRLQDALPLAQRAVSMRPNDDFAHHMLGAVLARQGRLDDAIAHLDAGDRLGPGGFWTYVGSLNRSIAFMIAGQYEQALEAIDPAVRVISGAEMLVQTMIARAKLNQGTQAQDATRQLRDIAPDMSRSLMEGIVRSLYCGANPVQCDDYAATVCRLWDATEPGA
jgi:TolB-like protein